MSDLSRASRSNAFSHSRKPHPITWLKMLLVFALLVVPLAIAATPTRAAPNRQSDSPDGNVVILKRVQNPDGTTDVTVRIYASPNAPNAPNTNFWISQDTYIASGNPESNYGSATNLAIGYNGGGPGAMRLLLQFNLSSIPSYATVNNAVIYIYQYAASGISNMGFQAQYAVSPWNEYNATWNNANYIGGAPLPVGNFPNTLGWLSFNSTNLIRNWVSGAQPNYGLIITGNEDPSGGGSSRYFYSSNAGSNGPYVDINYTIGCSYTTPPTSSVNPLPATSPNAFTVTWNGTPYTPAGCAANGISSYVVWYQVNHGDFVKWLDGVSYTFAQFNAASLGISNGSVVGFRSQAIDYYGNKTPAGDATAVTTINVPDTTPPATTMNPLPQYTTATSFWVSWNGSDVGSGVAYYNLQYQFNQGAWQTLISNTPQNSFYFQNAQTGAYGFRVQAVDYAGNAQPWPSSAQATTAVLVNPLALIKPFNPAIVQSAPPVTFTVSWQGYTPPGTQLTGYTVKYRYNSGTWQTMGVYPAIQTNAIFTATQGDGLYQFQATASNNIGTPSVELPGAYWKTMIVDSAHNGSITFLPLIAQNAQ